MASDRPREVRLGPALEPGLPGRIRDAPPGKEMEGIFLKDVFPVLRMGDWIASMLSEMRPGETTSFSALASAMGEIRAARAVGEVLSSVSIRGSHRVVHSDGRVPPGSLHLLSTEIDLPSGAVPVEDIVAFEAKDPPFNILKAIQIAMDSIPFEKVDPGPRMAGTDISCDRNTSAAALCLVDRAGRPLGETTVAGNLAFPYVPGYLFYREAPLLIPLLCKAREEGLMDEDPLVLIDGNGRLHPRRMGIAVQLGAICSEPTCGVAKRLLLGSVGVWSGDSAPILVDGEVLGFAVKKDAKRPFYVSEGTGPSLAECVQRLRPTLIGSNPEPLVMAHRLANRARRAQKP
jgi:deoxyribonuclease V